MDPAHQDAPRIRLVPWVDHRLTRSGRGRAEWWHVVRTEAQAHQHAAVARPKQIVLQDGVPAAQSTADCHEHLGAPSDEVQMLQRMSPAQI